MRLDPVAVGALVAGALALFLALWWLRRADADKASSFEDGFRQGLEARSGTPVIVYLEPGELERAVEAMRLREHQAKTLAVEHPRFVAHLAEDVERLRESSAKAAPSPGRPPPIPRVPHRKDIE